MIDATENPRFQGFMKLVDKYRTLGVRTNADTPQDAKIARQFGAEGIGLFRTEHMFYGEGSRPAAVPAAQDDPQQDGRGAQGRAGRAVPVRQGDIKATMEAMDGLPVTIRLLDPPLHEFVPQDPSAQEELAARWAFTVRRSRSAARPCTRPTP